MGLFGGPGLTPSLKGEPTNVIQLNSGQCYTLPAGWQMVKPGPYTSVQQYDPITGIWRAIGSGSTAAPIEYIYSDGVNYRLANQTGCAIGALLTNGGTGYTSAPTVTASAGGSIWRAVVGGAVSTSVTVTNGGTNYTYPPIVVFSAPPAGGVQATGYCTLSGSAVSTVTVTDQGAGYSAAPTITFVNDPREGVNNVTQGYGAAATSVLTGAGTVTAVLCTDHGTGNQTALPTLTFAGGGGASAAATVIMCWTITAYTVSATTAGSGYATPVIVSAYDAFPSTSPAYTNVTTQSRLLKTRAAQIIGAVSGTAMTATGQTVKDGGIYSAIPTVYAYGFIPGSSAVQAVFTSATMGGTTDISYLTPV
jgi:hypothetical protein